MPGKGLGTRAPAMTTLPLLLAVLFPLASNSTPTPSGSVVSVQSVAGNANPAWIADLATDLRWRELLRAGETGTASPAAVQGPVYDTRPTRSGQAVPSNGGTGQAAGGSWRGPGDTVGPAGGSPSGGAPRGGGAPAGPTAPGAVPGGGALPGAGLASVNTGSPSTPTLAMEVDDGWWLWWEYNKTEFLQPNGLAFWRITASGDDAAETWRKSIATLRSKLAADFAQASAEDDARVRIAAIDALAKIGSPLAVPQLLRALTDRSLEVRHHAILALGASHASEALDPLLSILRHGALAAEDERISPIAPAVAICALGLARRDGVDGFDEHVDRAVVERVQGRAKAEAESIATAAFVYQRLAPCEALELLALGLAENRDESPSVRCRAIEALSTSKHPEVVAKLQRLATGARMDERRSAILALGAIADERALPVLTAACASESEPLTRAFLLMSIARRGTDASREFLLKTAQEGKSSMRAWSALALGLASRDADAVEARKFLREGAAREKSREVIGAWWLALGLARDLEARGLLREALASGVDPRQRMYAGTALALIGDAESAVVLRERLALEDSAFLRAAYASALSLFGQERDAELLAKVVSDLRDPTLQSLASVALAFHGSRGALESLVSLASKDEPSRAKRATAIEGLSMMLGSTRPYSFGAVSRQANYTVFSDWFEGMLQVSL